MLAKHFSVFFCKPLPWNPCATMAFYSDGFLFSIVLVFDQCQRQPFDMVVVKIQRTVKQKLKIMALFRQYECYSVLYSIAIRNRSINYTLCPCEIIFTGP